MKTLLISLLFVNVSFIYSQIDVAIMRGYNPPLSFAIPITISYDPNGFFYRGNCYFDEAMGDSDVIIIRIHDARLPRAMQHYSAFSRSEWKMLIKPLADLKKLILKNDIKQAKSIKKKPIFYYWGKSSEIFVTLEIGINGEGDKYVYGKLTFINNPRPAHDSVSTVHKPIYMFNPNLAAHVNWPVYESADYNRTLALALNSFDIDRLIRSLSYVIQTYCDRSREPEDFDYKRRHEKIQNNQNPYDFLDKDLDPSMRKKENK